MYTGRTTTGFVVKDDLEGGWIVCVGECGVRSDGVRLDVFVVFVCGVKL